MGRPRFGRRSTPPKISQTREDADFVVPKGETLLCLSPNEDWTYGERGIDGAFRLISVARLLDRTGPTIQLLEWTGFNAWPLDRGPRIGRTGPPGWPSYAGISHVWEPSDDAARISANAKKPLRIDIGGSTHSISWLGLIQAATTAKAGRCKYLWLDLLCINQNSRSDKAKQIKQMSRIYSNARLVIVMVGGVVAAQGFDKSSSWINRAWTFQEATLGLHTYVLVDWDLSGSFSYFRALKGNIAVARLKALCDHPFGENLGVSTMIDSRKAEREFNLDLPIRCLGDNPAVITALASVLRDADDHQSSEFSKSTFDMSLDTSSSDPFDMFEASEDSTFEESDLDDRSHSDPEDSAPEGGDIGNRSTLLFDDSSKGESYLIPVAYEDDSDQNLGDKFNSGFGEDCDHIPTTYGRDPGQNYSSNIDRGDDGDSNHAPTTCVIDRNQTFRDEVDNNFDIDFDPVPTTYGRSSSQNFDNNVDNDLDHMPSTFTNDFGDTSSDSFYNEAHKSTNPVLQPPSGIQHGAVWRSMWLRTSTKEQDLVFSMMHLLGVVIDVDYDRPLKDLVFELIEKTSSTPAWLAIGYSIPVYPESGLIPLLPEFTPNSIPIYNIDKKSYLASDFVCADFKCDRFDVVIKSTSTANGHLICAMIWDVKNWAAPKAGEDSFYESELHLACTGYEVDKTCRFKGRLGSIVVIIGDYCTSDQYPWEDINTLFVYFLDKDENQTWQKTGAGALVGPLFSSPRIRSQRRHLQVGGRPGAELLLCDCPERKELTIDDDGDDPVGLVQDLGRELAEALYCDREQRARQLIEMGADVNAQVGEPFGSPLLSACYSDNKRMVQLLIELGADVDAPGDLHASEFEPTGEWRGTPLQAACRRHSEGVVRLLIENGADVNIQEGPEGTALQAALKWSFHKPTVQLLLNHGANVNAQCGFYGNALMTAQADLEDSIATSLLIEQGAQVNSIEGIHHAEDGEICRTALQMACLHLGGTLLLNRVQLFIAKGADVNLRSGGTFDTALQEAAYHGHPLVCETLLKRGAESHIQGGHFGNALQAAVVGNATRPHICEQIVELLLEDGVDVNTPGGCYGSALQAAAAVALDDTRVLLLLLQKGADINARGGRYGTAIQAAAASGNKNEDVFGILLDAGANVNVRGGLFGSALQAAIYRADNSRGYDRIVNLLVQSGAEIDVNEPTSWLEPRLSVDPSCQETGDRALHHWHERGANYDFLD